MRKQQYISLLFLFAVSLVLAHNIIPHHHYDESCFTNNCLKNQAAHGQSEKSSKVPWHCQAFNHVVFVEQQLSFKLRPFLSEQLLTYDNQLTGVYVFFEPENKCCTYLPEAVANPLISNSLLRAPPALV